MDCESLELEELETAELRCPVILAGDGIRQARSAREQFLRSVKLALSAKCVTLHTTNTVPDAALDDDQAGRYTNPLLLIIPCITTSSVETNLSSTIDKITTKREHNKLLVVFHPRAIHDVHVPQTRQQVSPEMLHRCELIVDVVFDRTSGAIFPIQMNRMSEERMTEYLSKQASTVDIA